jgi:hypothetical protein
LMRRASWIAIPNDFLMQQILQPEEVHTCMGWDFACLRHGSASLYFEAEHLPKRSGWNEDASANAD